MQARAPWSYSRLRGVRPRELIAGRDRHRIATTLARAARDGRRVTVRAGGRSFDDQALDGDVVLEVSAYDRVLAFDGYDIVVAAGATWGAIVGTPSACGGAGSKSLALFHFTV